MGGVSIIFVSRKVQGQTSLGLRAIRCGEARMYASSKVLDCRNTRRKYMQEEERKHTSQHKCKATKQEFNIVALRRQLGCLSATNRSLFRNASYVRAPYAKLTYR